MRLKVVLVLALGGLAALSTTAGCGDDTTSTGGTGGTGGAPTGAKSSASSGGSALPCDATAAVCLPGKSKCIGLVDNMGKDKFAVRMAQLDLVGPAPLAGGLVGPLIARGVQMNLSDCNLTGDGTFTLLLEFDKTNKKLTAGGAKPVADPTKGYQFLNQMVMGKQVGPVVIDITLDEAGTFAPIAGADIILPIYLAGSVDPAVLLPLKKAVIKGKLADNNNCVGSYKADMLDPLKDCASSAPFTTGADLDAHITLTDADDVIIGTPLNQSLCVLLSGNAPMYGDGMMPNKCKKTAGVIDFKGDWCAATNMPTDGMCNDAVKLQGRLAASSVLVNP